MKLELNTNTNYRGLRNIKDQLELINQKKNRNTVTDGQELGQIKLNYNLNNTFNLIYDVLSNRTSYTYKIPCTAGINCQNSNTTPRAIRAQNTLFFNQSSHIYIPNKVLHVLQKYVSKFQLRKVDDDVNVAIEYCLLFLMLLDSTSYTNDNNQYEDVWKSLNAAVLREFFTTDPLCYKKITSVLSTPTSKGTIIDCDRIFIKGTKNYHYRLADNYRGKGYSTYKLETTKAKALLHNYHQKKWDSTKNNVICQNLITFYQSVTLPTLSEVENEADRLISIRYKNKKGKRLKRLNKHAKSYFKDSDKYCFVEDAIKIFQRLTENGIMIPRAGGDASGGRVVDSFTLMPSWIRKLVNINGKPMIECDYSCLHPNIAVSLYGGSLQNLTHKHIENVLGLDKDLVKTEHLSFFNKDVWQMKESPLYDYYNKYEKWMLNNIIREKRNDNEYKYKITSRRLFKIEVELMTEVITILNNENIFVGYVYDALFFDPIYGQRVKEVMDVVAVQMRVFTTAKLT